jgi:hypothetical protein
MKSIEEKSNEYAKEYLFSPLPQRAPNVHFVAGANYVLEVVESILEDKELDVEETYDKIYATIKQLKK